MWWGAQPVHVEADNQRQARPAVRVLERIPHRVENRIPDFGVDLRLKDLLGPVTRVKKKKKLIQGGNYC